VVKQFQPQVTGRVSISPANYAAILTGLEGVITSGTAAGPFQGFPTSWHLAGKTGTASNGTMANGQPEEPNSWFVAFGPNPNPQYLVLAVIDQGGYGAQAAAPLVRNIFDYLVTNPVAPVKLPTLSSPPTATAPTPSAPFGAPTTTTTAPKPGTGTATTTTTAPSGG
ncbi:MAG TPA: penicillin-binding transpeptidase domain-containing protein, partial [Acidimicrobiales bacterium]